MMEHYSALIRKKILSHAFTCDFNTMTFDIMLSEKSQTQKGKYYMIPLT